MSRRKNPSALHARNTPLDSALSPPVSLDKKVLESDIVGISSGKGGISANNFVVGIMTDGYSALKSGFQRTRKPQEGRGKAM